MTEARQRILSALGPAKGALERPASFEVGLSDENKLELFKVRAEAAGFNTLEISDVKELPFMEGKARNVIAQTALKELDFVRDRVERFGKADDQTYYGFTKAEAAVAETGSVLVRSAPELEFSLHLLVEEEIIALNVEDIVLSLNEMWPVIRQLDAESRAFSLITGPSKTADVEQTLQIGAHGPRATHILLYS